MAVTHLIYGSVFLAAFNKEVDINAGDTIKTSLHTSTYSANQDTHDYYNDVTNEITGTNYSAGGATLGSAVHTYTGGTNVYAFDANDAVWTTLTTSSSPSQAVTYADTAGANTTDPLLTVVDFGGNQTVTAATFTIQWAAGGIFTVTVA